MTLIEFLIKAKTSTYADGTKYKVPSTKPNSIDYHYKKDNFIYHDTYYGNKEFYGREMVYVNGKFVWYMEYEGGVLNAESTNIYDKVLKPALKNIDNKMPLRGPHKFSIDDYKYVFETNGSIRKFDGIERIYKKEKLIYELKCHGGSFNKKIKWVFFDVGTTLVDEENAYDYRVLDMIKNRNITFEEFDSKRIELAKQGLDGNSAAIKEFGLIKTQWHSEKEILYYDAIELLLYLKNKKYKLGIIANQKKGLQKRLEEFGILEFFDLVIASAEVGVSKPDKEIFEIALAKANCKPNECIMIGDRLDNDIIPANQIGMKTIWIRQGLAKYQAIKLGMEYSNFVVSSLSEIEDIL